MAERRARRSFTRKFKEHVVKRLLEGGGGLPEVARSSASAPGSSASGAPSTSRPARPMPWRPAKQSRRNAAPEARRGGDPPRGAGDGRGNWARRRGRHAEQHQTIFATRMLYRAVFLCFPGGGRIPTTHDRPLKPLVGCVFQQRSECIALAGAVCDEPDLEATRLPRCVGAD
jgi:hypothetical protein